MRKLAFGASLIGAFGLLAIGCGGGGSSPDAGDIVVPPDAEGNGGACNVVENTGCGAGEKCGFILAIEDTGTGYIGCIEDGTQGLGQECMGPQAVETSDNCAGGGYCYNGTCRATCATGGGQCGDGVCADNFVDGNNQPFPLAWCLLGCDPLEQDCPTANEACFLSNTSTSGGVCIRNASEVPVGMPCQFANSCVHGAGCFGDPGVCRQYCGVVEDMWQDFASDDPWPMCCGTDCDNAPYNAVVSCPLSTDLCWVVGGSEPNTIRTDVGICLTETEASNPDGTTPWNCDCSTSPNPDGVCESIGGAATSQTGDKAKSEKAMTPAARPFLAN